MRVDLLQRSATGALVPALAIVGVGPILSVNALLVYAMLVLVPLLTVALLLTRHPVGALAPALVFGFAESLQSKLAILSTPIPSEFLLMAPYLVTVLVVAGIVGRSRAPAADGEPYPT